MIAVNEADRLLLEHMRTLAPVSVPLANAARRVLREDLVADRDYPPFDRVAMDGVAINSAALASAVARFPIESTQRAGEAPHALANSAACIEVMTGAVLPRGCDTVIRYEDLEIADGAATLKQKISISARQNIHAQGTDRRCGEIILRAGTRLAAPQIAVAASVGKSVVQVAPLQTFAFVTTGDELVDVDAPVLPHQIRKSNAPAVAAALARYGNKNVQQLHARDTEAELAAVIEAALASSDVVLLSGGVSMGKFDFVPRVLESAGVRNVFHKIAQKPGKPLWFGVRDDGRPVFGLPGNPVSALVCLYRYVLPFLDAQAGLGARLPRTLLCKDLPKIKTGMTHFVPVRHTGFLAEPIRENGSGDFASLAESDGFIEITSGTTAPNGGGVEVPYFPWVLA